MARYISFLLFITLVFGSPFMGISHSASSEPAGILVSRVVKGSPADIAGLQVDDIIVRIDDTAIENQEELSAKLSEKSPGDLITLTVIRCNKETRIRMILGRRDDFQGEMRKGGRVDFPTDAMQIMPSWRDNTTLDLVFEAIDKAEYNEQYDSLASAFAQELEKYSGYYTLDVVALGLLQPAATYSSGEWIKQILKIETARPKDLIDAAPYILDARDNDLNLDERVVAPGGIDFHSSGLDRLVEAVQRANADVDRAFSALTDEELDDIATTIPFLLNTLSRTIYIDSDSDEGLVERYIDLIALSKKVDYDALLTAGRHLAALYDDNFLDELSKIEYDENIEYENDIIIDTMVTVAFTEDSLGNPVGIMGRMIVSGRGSGTYTEEAAIWLDLGGDDTYLGFCGGTPYTIYDNVRHNFPWGRVGLHIDLGGDDTYIRNTVGSIGSGFLGVGCLIDVDGDDKYIGNRLTMGSAFLGVGIHIDGGGDDVFAAQEFAQGFAAFGCGILYNHSGDDLYQGARFVQGVGLTKGLGILLDNSGDDQYFASFKVPNSYGNENTWDGWSQGMGMGFRMLAAGGVGLLVDRAGDDYYHAGNFSQACGYFFGFGLLDDFGGNDKVIGNRYVQGSGAHQALGYFRNRAGDDFYYGQEAMNQAGAWDIQSVFFIDDSGNDTYYGHSYSQGGTAQTAFAVFIDRDGKDSYESGRISNGTGGAFTYHPYYYARNLSIFLDLGGDDDDYSKTHSGRENNKFITTSEEDAGDGIFWDK